MATVRDIAEMAGVSISTVSRVINGYQHINDRTRLRVKEAMGALGYEGPSRPCPKGSVEVGIIIPQATGSDIMTHPTIYSILSAISRGMDESGIGYSVLMTDHEAAREYDNILRSEIGAYILLGTDQTDEDELIPRIQSRKAPVIVVNRWLKKSRISYVNMDDIQGSSMATEYLVKLGHRRIAIVNGDSAFRNSQMRFDGYSRVLGKYGIPVEPKLSLSGSYSEEWGRQAALRIHKMDDKPTAVFATSDIIALGLHRGFEKLGYRLPGDMSIVGFGDVEFAKYLHPALTTVRVPAREIGMQTVMVLKTLMSSSLIRFIKVALEAQLIVRESAIPKIAG